MDEQSLVDALAWYALFLFSTVCHEAAHAWAAWRLGDPTAKRRGQVSLDPLPHIRREPVGMVLVPLISIATGTGMIGWASTPYDARWAAAYPRRAAWMALAGPAANLGLVLIGAGLMHLGLHNGDFYQPQDISYTLTVGSHSEGWREGAAKLLSILFSLNLILFAFNLIPLPPMDGGSAVSLLLPLKAAARLKALLSQPLARLVGLLVAWNAFPYALGPIHNFALNLLYWGSNYH